MGQWMAALMVLASAVVQWLGWRSRPRSGWESELKLRVKVPGEVERSGEVKKWTLLAGQPGLGKSQAIAGMVAPLRADGAIVYISSPDYVERSLLPASDAPDLLSVAQDEQAVAGVVRMHEGLDSLFRALGPPPEGGLSELQRVDSGSGGTVH
ncbi:hypothetical protein GCM10012285_41960 [Streptomyces kronopolitis]|uniref:Uncharacterized protein n=1 Tax=Streptomyces kronopolitis TaxID=1612435 RepID=A0ABQ2JRK3_9ACTN|nr:hypothetical protein GCM10012285_41960 [Streptomyces kronopolitis]